MIRSFDLCSRSGTTIRLIEGQEASHEFSKIDVFISSMSKFDLQSRMNTDEDVTIEQYIAFINKHLISWNDKCIEEVKTVIDALNKDSSDVLKLCNLPEEIFIILTNGKDESNAAYCRNMNMIVLPLAVTETSDPALINTLTKGHNWGSTLKHELFHILSKNNVPLQDKLYESIGFSRLGKAIVLPNPDLKITNPDAPVTEHYIRLIRKTTGTFVNMAPVIVASSAYVPESNPNFFKYLQVRLLVLTDNGVYPGVSHDDLDSTDELLSHDDVIGFYECVGMNTKYIIHPEEILADNFVLLLDHSSDVSSPFVLEAFKVILESL
jgi:hypothetical protein